MASAREAVIALIAVTEVADYLLVIQLTVYRQAVRRKMPRFKAGASWRFKRASIEGLIAAQMTTPAAADVAEGARAP